MKFNKLVPTIEDLDGDVIEVDPSDEGVASAEAEVTEAVSESEAGLADVETVDSALDDAGDAVEVIDEVTGVLHEGGEGEATDLETAAVQTTVESIYSRLGLKPRLATLESFSSKPTRAELISTLESEKEGLMERIKRGLQAALNMVIEFMSGLLKNTWLLEKYLKNVQEKVRGISNGAEPKANTMVESAAAMSVSGDASAASIQPMFETAEALLGLADGYVDMINKFNMAFDPSREGDVPYSFEVYLKDTDLPPRQFQEFGGFLTGDRAIAYHGRFATRQDNVHDKKATWVARKAAQAAVPSRQTMDELLTKAQTIINGIKRVKGKQNTLKNAVSRILQKIVQVGSVFFFKPGEKQFSLQWKIEQMRKILGKGISTFTMEAFRTAKAFIDYAKHGAAMYQGSFESEDNPNAPRLGHTPKSDGHLYVDGVEGEGTSKGSSKRDIFGKRKFGQ